MPLFICENCKCVENTALGHYWSRHIKDFKGTEFEKALCSECLPLKFPDGSFCKSDSKWHGKFPKQTIEECLKEYPECEFMNFKEGKFL